MSRLTLVGTGYRVAGQVTPETRVTMETADVLFYLVTDPATASWLRTLNPRATSLHDCYREGEDGAIAARQMAERMVAPLREGRSVCAAFSGHPAVLVHAARLAAEQASTEGFAVSMLPAISCEDCLFAELGVDPTTSGLHTYEATYFFVRRPRVDPHATLVLLQVGMLGEAGGAATDAVAARFRLLLDRLVGLYGLAREAILYEASPYPGTAPAIDRFALGDGEGRAPSVMSTLCVPGQSRPPVDPDARQALELSGG
jgi:Tetrapyrrole (Corrin/Porphyrin) Methylases